MLDVIKIAPNERQLEMAIRPPAQAYIERYVLADSWECGGIDDRAVWYVVLIAGPKIQLHVRAQIK